MWAALIPAIISAVSMLASRGGSTSGTSMSQNQQLLMDDALSEQNRRMTMQGPLSDMVTRLAMALMPRSAGAPPASSLTTGTLGPVTPPGQQGPGATPPGTGAGNVGGGYGRGPSGGQGNYPTGSGTSAALAALAGGLTAPTSTSQRGVSLQRPATLFQMPSRGGRQV